jgi:hypothetical protein
MLEQTAIGIYRESGKHNNNLIDVLSKGLVLARLAVYKPRFHLYPVFKFPTVKIITLRHHNRTLPI